MKNISLFIAGIAFAFLAQAQSPIITQENAYLVGDQTIIAWCSNPTSPGDAGANVTWDFSNLNEVDELTFDYVEPGSTLFGYQFPNATLCGRDDDNYHSFYSISGGFLNVEGYAGYDEGTTDTLKIIYTNTEQYIPLPFEFGDTHSDTFEGSSSAFGFNVSLEGELDFEADGYGTLILPNGTYDNAIRYRLDRTQDNTVLGQTTTTTKEQWGWMSPDYRFWLCLMETNNDGFGSEDIVWYSKNPLLLSNEELEVSKIKVYPNPARSSENIFFESDFESIATIEFFSVDGKLVKTENQFISSGQNSIQLDEPLPNGVYTLSIFIDNHRLVSKIIIH